MPHTTVRELESLMDELALGTQPTPTRLALLSDLPAADAEAVRSRWDRIPASARASLLVEATDLAEGDVTLNFERLACIALGDPEAPVRLSAIAALWESRGRAVARQLADLLANDPEESVREASAGALREFVVAREFEEFDTETGDAIVEALRSAFEDRAEAVNVRAAAIESLGSRTLPWVATLITDAYYDDDRLLRIAAVRAMADSGDERWLDLLAEDLESSDPDLRFEAVMAVGEIGGNEALELVTPLLEDEDRQVLVAAIRALGAIGGDDAIALLQELHQNIEERELVDEATAAEDLARYGEEGEREPWDA